MLFWEIYTVLLQAPVVRAINDTLVMFLLYLKQYYWLRAQLNNSMNIHIYHYLVPNEGLRVICGISRNNSKKDEEREWKSGADVALRKCVLYQYLIPRHRCICTFKSCNQDENAGKNDGKSDICALHVFESITNDKKGTEPNFIIFKYNEIKCGV